MRTVREFQLTQAAASGGGSSGPPEPYVDTPFGYKVSFIWSNEELITRGLLSADLRSINARGYEDSVFPHRIIKLRWHLICPAGVGVFTAGSDYEAIEIQARIWDGSEYSTHSVLNVMNITYTGSPVRLTVNRYPSVSMNAEFNARPNASGLDLIIQRDLLLGTVEWRCAIGAIYAPATAYAGLRHVTMNPSGANGNLLMPGNDGAAPFGIGFKWFTRILGGAGGVPVPLVTVANPITSLTLTGYYSDATEP